MTSSNYDSNPFELTGEAEASDRALQLLDGNTAMLIEAWNMDTVDE